MNEFVKALGIDYGDARIGLAASDDLGLLAHPLETVPAVPREDALARIAAVVEVRAIEDLVLGLPLRMDGGEGPAVEKVRRFGKELRARLPASLRFHEVDERLTTVTAMEKLHRAGRNEKNSRGIIDQAAAVEILQDWLDQRTGNPPYGRNPGDCEDPDIPPS